MWRKPPLGRIVVRSSVSCASAVQWRASRIRGHILNICGPGVQPCTVEESKLKPAVKVLRKVERLSAARQEQGAEKRQLDTETASDSSAAAEQQGAKKQKTLAECTSGATKVKCGKAVACLVYADGLPLSLTDSPYFRDIDRR